MSKIMLVEDDDSLREIYSIRLTAEGYAIVTAHDGEEALAVAVRERPDLIVSDVMMPKITGFDMLDILRSTPETKDIKVIMMTALSSEDQRVRGESLGADRYLVKSQVGIEDVVNVVHEVLGDRGQNGVINTSATARVQAQSAPQMQAMPTAQTISVAPGTQPQQIQPSPATQAMPVQNQAASVPMTSGMQAQTPQASAGIQGTQTQPSPIAQAVPTQAMPIQNQVPPAPVASGMPTQAMQTATVQNQMPPTQ